MVSLDYLLLSIKADQIVSIGRSWISDLVSELYTKRFPGVDRGDESAFEGNEPGNLHRYHYPRLQYKVIKGAPLISAVNEGCSLLWEINSHLDHAAPGCGSWQIMEKRFIEKRVSFGLSEKQNKYRFLTPWLSLNEESIEHFSASDPIVRQKILCRILAGHIRDMAHSIGYEIPGELVISIMIKADYIFQDDIRIAGFLGSFHVNFEIPDFLGLGRSVSRGFGAVKRISPA